MFQNTDPTAARITFASLLLILSSALSGCAGPTVGSVSRIDRTTEGYRNNQTLAVLLPMSGRFAEAAQVVLDGIVAAQDADPQGSRPTLRFYDSAAGSVTSLVQKAAADGASLVIGPLQKPAVDQLADTSSLPIPVLALNQASTAGSAPRNLYQFALSPEGEAAEVANNAWAKGYSRALMLYPEGNWGSRISRAFRGEWKAHGGTVIAAQVFDPSAEDLSESVAALSEHSAGADFLFLVATSQLARRISPRIRQEIGSEIPVYSTSHIYSGRFDPQRDRGLVGLNFVEIPWLVEPARDDVVSSKGLHGKLPRLYAMGVDAYRLGPRLYWMSHNPRARFQGKTGILSMDSRGRIYRKLTLARIEATGPVKAAGIDTERLKAFVWAEPSKGIGPRLAALRSPDLAALRP